MLILKRPASTGAIPHAIDRSQSVSTLRLTTAAGRNEVEKAFVVADMGLTWLAGHFMYSTIALLVTKRLVIR